MATKVSPHDNKNAACVPFVLDILPGMSAQDLEPREMLLKSISRWPQNIDKPHIIADSAFGCTEVLEEMEKLKFCGTLSLKKSNEPRLCNLLSHKLPKDTFRIIQKDKFVVHGQGITKDGKHLKHKFLLSTGMTFTPKNMPEPPIQKLPNISLSYDELNKLKIMELDKILHDFDLPKGKLNKKEKIKVILNTVKHSSVICPKYSQISWFFENCFEEKNPVLHNLYENQFDTVDLLEKTISEASERHGNTNWRSKKLLSILNIAIFNCFCVNSYYTNTLFGNWQETLAVSILDNIKK